MMEKPPHDHARETRLCLLFLRVDPMTEELHARPSCNYQGYEFGAGRYPDSVCIDGQLFDADDCDGQGNLYEPDEYMPCPICQPKKAVAYWAARNHYGGASRQKARAAAQALVKDIREKRGIS